MSAEVFVLGFAAGAIFASVSMLAVNWWVNR